MSKITGIWSDACESGNENESGGVVFPSYSPSPFPGIWVVPLSFESSLVRAP